MLLSSNLPKTRLTYKFSQKDIGSDKGTQENREMPLVLNFTLMKMYVFSQFQITI